MLLRAIGAMPEAVGGRALPEPIAALSDGGTSSLLTEFDLVKRSVIRAVGALRIRDAAAARQSLIEVRHDHHFGAWAEQRLQELK
jgi:hypothetical protein